MIKIQIDDVIGKEQEYVDGVQKVVLVRLNVLKTALENLLGNVLVPDDMNLASLKPITKAIIDLVEGKVDMKLNGRMNYQNEITNYVNSGNNLNVLNINGMLSLLNYLLIDEGSNLDHLLSCKADQLMALNNSLLNNNAVNNELDLDVLKLGFNYQKFDEIAGVIKFFFRSNNFVKYCPYCNAEKTEFNKTALEKPVTSHQLDHFFDKASHPLLCYSMYNLVPSDATCNSTNKYKTLFSDEYYLNPYIDGFGSSIAFVPQVVGTDYHVTTIKIQVHQPPGSNICKRLIGDNTNVNENDDKGNINVFKLQSKYNSVEMRDKAAKILNDIHSTMSGNRAIKKFLNVLDLQDNPNNYIRWYRKNLCTPFTYDEFNNGRYSKFNRDIHDYYFAKDRRKKNNYVRQLITDNQN